MPSRAALMSVMVPVKVMVASAVPSPVTKVRPVVPASVNVPLVAVSVTLTALEPASTSLTEMRLPLAVEKTSAVSSLTVCAPGTELTGATLATSSLVTLTSVGSSPL